MANLNWQGDRATSLIRAEMRRRIEMACVVVEGHARVLIGREGADKGAPGRGAGGRFTKGKLVYGARRSAPGEPPMTQTGRLKTSVAHEVDGMVGRVGTNVPYGKALELGTGNMAARPWLRRALVEYTAAVRALLSAPMNLK